MHIPEGALTHWPVLAAGGAVAVAGTAVGLRRMREADVPRAGLAAAFLFVASFIHVPAGAVSAHLVLNGLTGLLLGWAVFPAFLVVLFLQAVLFSFGGLTTLGVNTMNLAAPAVVCYYVFRCGVRGRGSTAAACGVAAGATAIALSALLTALCLLTESEAFSVAVLIAHVPILVAEGVIGGFAVGFLRTVRPELLGIAAERVS